MSTSDRCPEITVLDVGGEGRHPEAWNLNPSPVKTLGPDRGEVIPRRIPGRGEEIPLEDSSVERVIVERTPLRPRALAEIARIIAPAGTIVLRHAKPRRRDPHSQARKVLPGISTQRHLQVGNLTIQETEFRVGQESQPSAS